MATPRFFYFDMGNVLLAFSHQLAAAQVASLSGISPELAYKIVFDDGLHWEFERGELTPQAFYERYCAAAGARPPRDQFELATNAIFKLNAPIVPIVAHLRSAGYRLGVLSNTSESHWDYVTARFPFLNKLFHVHALSYRLGVMKPAAAIYEQAAQLAGCESGEIFFTDDRPENVAAAQAAGYDAVLFSSVRQLAHDLHERGVVTNY